MDYRRKKNQDYEEYERLHKEIVKKKWKDAKEI